MCLVLPGGSQLQPTAQWLALALGAGSRQAVSEGMLGQALTLRFGKHPLWVFLKGPTMGREQHHREWLG